MPKIQSTNIGSLCSELGFDGNSPSRETKTLTEAVKKFRLEFVEKGNDLTFSRSDNPEARHFARCFCEGDNRGNTFWPLTEDNRWPSWQADKEKILKPLAHIFALQAFYEYQGVGKARRRSNKPSQRSPSIHSEAHSERELSPESRIYIVPSPPKGTKRRPAKLADPNPSTNKKQMATINGDNSNMLDEPEVRHAAEEEIAAIDPRKDDKPIREFTKDWLYKKDAAWPEAADTRLRALMHENNTYDPSSPEYKLIAVVTGLRQGTELSSGTSKDYKILEKRVSARLNIMVSRLADQKLLEKNEKGVLERTPIFKHFWRYRHGHWAPKTQASKILSPKIPENNETFDFGPFLEQGDQPTELISPLTPAKTPPKAPRLPKNFEGNGVTTASRVRKEPNGELRNVGNQLAGKKQKTLASVVNRSKSPNDDTEDQPAAKRQKISTSAAKQDDVNLPLSTLSQRVISNLQTSTNPTSSSHPSSTNLVQDHTLLPPKHISTPPPDLPSISNLASPINLHITGSEALTSTASTNTNPIIAQPQQTPKDPPSHRSPSIINTRHPPLLKRLIFILPKSGKPEDPDLLDPVSFEQIRNMTSLNFFQLVAEKAHIPLTELPCLTFTLVFTTEGQMELVKAEDEKNWIKFKKRTEWLFKTSRSKPWHKNETEFEVGVEIGNWTGGEEDDEKEDLYGA